LSATKISADDDIRSIDPLSRKCYFDDEIGTLEVHKEYTQTNCVLECSLNYSKETLKTMYNLSEYCTPWYFPSHDEKITICDPWKTVTFMKLFASVPKDKCQKCLPGSF
jgi:hypothetical protein